MSTVRIQVRRGTASEWTSANPTLAAGEMGVETDTRKIKVGTGSTAWTSLSYIASDAPGITEIAQDAIDTALSMGSGLTKSYNDATNTISLNIDSSVVALKSYVDSQITGLDNAAAEDYVLLADVGNAGGPAKLDVDGNLLVPKSSIILEGATADAFETTLTVVDPTADRTITLPNATGTVVLKDSTDTLTNKSISLTTNTITGTKAQFNSAMSDADFASLAGSETLTNKTLTSPIISSITNGAATLTLPTSTGTVALTSDITSAVNNLVDAAPGALDTLNELAAAIGDDANYAAGVTSALGTLTTGLGNLSAAGVSHASTSTNVHGIADTANLATKSYADQAEADANSYADSAIGTAMTNHSTDSTDVHGIVNTADLMLKSGSTMTGALTLNGAPGFDLQASTKKYVDDTKNTHAAVTLNVHGIADTSLLATTANVATAKSEAIAAVTVTSLSLQNVNNTSDINKPVSTATQTALDLKANLAGPTFTGTVSGITKSMVGLGNVDNTTDAGKPVSTATQTALDLKANLASPTLTGTPLAPTAATGTNTTQVATTGFVQQELSILTTGAPALLNTLDELAAALGDDANYAATVTTALSTKAPLASPTFTGTVSGVTKSMVGLGSVDNTADSAKPVSTAQQTALDLKAPIASPTFTGTVTVAAAGIVFSDGTQTKAGVPSITTFGTEITSSATLAAGEKDKFVPLNGAVEITLPSSGYSTGASIDFYQSSGTGASFASTNSVVGTPGLKFRTTNSVVTAMKTPSGWLVFGDLKA